MTRKSALVWALAAGACAAPVALALTSVAAHAQTVVQQYQPAGVLSLNAQASADVPQDVVRGPASGYLFERSSRILAERIGARARVGGSEKRHERRLVVRGVFARGALSAALWLSSRPPGRYGMRDFLFAKTEG